MATQRKNSRELSNTDLASNKSAVVASKESIPTRNRPSRVGQGSSKISLGRVFDDEEVFYYAPIKWINIIFLPFQTVFQLIILYCVFVKTTIGPLQAVYPIATCHSKYDNIMPDFLKMLNFSYNYLVDPFYLLDFFLHVVHRQVIDESSKQEYVAKPFGLLLLDIVALLPLYKLTASGPCPSRHIWPNICAFNEVVIIYRVYEYFSLTLTHSLLRLSLGYIMFLVILINCVTCFILLLTFHGFCNNCTGPDHYDWRYAIQFWITNLHTGFNTYKYATIFVLLYLTNRVGGTLFPYTNLEYILSSGFLIAAFFFKTFVIIPKLFSENLLRMRRYHLFNMRAKRLVLETKRRNPDPQAYIEVENYYSLLWNKRRGISSLPRVLNSFPRYLIVEIRHDLAWSLFYHSPTFRYTSDSYKRYISTYIEFFDRSPGDNLFIGPKCHSKLYYIKSGVVQLMSDDDNTSPLLSLSGGTILGDINFYVPPLKRKIKMRCLTYCEIFAISRSNILMSFTKYPIDRFEVMQLVHERIQHARKLYLRKKKAKITDRTHIEGMAWLKRRWWDISDTLKRWKMQKNDLRKYRVPEEEQPFHCVKYIGQLVMCNHSLSKTLSMLSKPTFPWMFLPSSHVIKIWRRVVTFTTCLVLLLYPPNLCRTTFPNWFLYFNDYVDTIFVIDVFIVSLTSVRKRHMNFCSLLLEKFKQLGFLMDLLSTPLFQLLMSPVELSETYDSLLNLNRLLKIHIFFDKNSTWKLKQACVDHFFKSIMIQGFAIYISAYIIYIVSKFIPNLTVRTYFGTYVCNPRDKNCDQVNKGLLSIFYGFLYMCILGHNYKQTELDYWLKMLIIFFGTIFLIYMQSELVAHLYLVIQPRDDYNCFVNSVKDYYNHHKIHPDLMCRLNRYLLCHWRYFRGIEIIRPANLRKESYNIYRKVHGDLAEKFLSKSKLFKGADIKLIRELAENFKYLIIPKNSGVLLFGMRPKNLTFLVHGMLDVEFHDDNDEIVRISSNTNEELCVTSVLYNKPSYKTYIAETDIETLFLGINTFFVILKRYPNEWAILKACMDEFQHKFKKIFASRAKKYKDYQKKNHKRIFHNLHVASKHRIASATSIGPHPTTKLPYIGFLEQPESTFLTTWFTLRMLSYLIYAVAVNLSLTSGAVYYDYLCILMKFHLIFTIFDIGLKLFLPYYDDRGIIITSIWKCMVHYITRTFLVDCITVFRIANLAKDFLEKDKIGKGLFEFIESLHMFLQLYLFTGYFDYMLDQPTPYSNYLMILKWIIIIVLVMLSAATFFLNNCITITLTHLEFYNFTMNDHCWLPDRTMLSEFNLKTKLHLIYAKSLCYAQCAYSRTNVDKFTLIYEDVLVLIIVTALGIIFWYFICYCRTLLLLEFRGNAMFQHGVQKLVRFLEFERVEKPTIDKAVNYFTYCWKRSYGVNISGMLKAQVGVVFKEDLNYYFYRKTLAALDTELHGGENFRRQLANSSHIAFFLKDSDIMREMDLTPMVYIVHRGSVIIRKDSMNLATITKGGIFGQLLDTDCRPIRVTATAIDFCDVLTMTAQQFQEILTPEVRETMKKFPTVENDYMVMKKMHVESPYNTVQYLLRGNKTIRLPWMRHPVHIYNNVCYYRWLYCIWLIITSITVVVSMSLLILPRDLRITVLMAMEFLDFLYFLNFIGEFYTVWILMTLDCFICHYSIFIVLFGFFCFHIIITVIQVEIVVQDKKCVYKYIRLQKLKQLGFYCDLISLITSVIAICTHIWWLHLLVLLRLHHFFDFYRHYCKSFKSRLTPIILKFVMLFIIMHGCACVWIKFACRSYKHKTFPIRPYNSYQKRTINPEEWCSPLERRGGCARPILSYNGDHNPPNPGRYVVSKWWPVDYILSFFFVIVNLTNTNIDIVADIDVSEMYLKLFIVMVLSLVAIWISAVSISMVYTNVRELYRYDYEVKGLCLYLKYNGLSLELLKSIYSYSRLLWDRQRGNCLPEMALNAPLCLREDMFTSLYIHHLESPPVFRDIPYYVLRQVATRFRSTVIFPGKYIVQEGDVWPSMYFIHEGEIEKWYTDSNGDSRIVCVLTQNNYFGITNTLFPNEPHAFTYVTRTVAEVVNLHYADWIAVLNGYPDVKNTLYSNAQKMRKSEGRQKKK